jgi:hypothetical protein
MLPVITVTLANFKGDYNEPERVRRTRLSGKTPFNDVISRSHKPHLQRCDALFARPGKKEHQVTGIVDPGAAGGILAGEPVFELLNVGIHNSLPA